MTDEYMKKVIARYIATCLDKRKEVAIESGAANDTVIGYEKRSYKRFLYGNTVELEEEFKFVTTAAIFPREVNLNDFDEVDYEEFKGSIFLKVK